MQKSQRTDKKNTERSQKVNDALNEMNFHGFMDFIVERYNRHIAIKDDGKSFSYQDLFFSVEMLVNYFHENGYRQRRIFIKGRLDFRWISLFLGIVCSGNIAVLVDEASTPLHDLVKNFSNALLLYDNELKTTNIFECELLNYEQLFNNFANYSASHKKTYSRHSELSPNSYSISEDDPAVIAFSSGSTGFPKEVELTHQNLISNIHHCWFLFENLFGQDDCVIPLLPPTHLFGLTVGLLVPMLYGATIVFPAESENPLSTIIGTRPTTLILVPTILESLFRMIQYNISNHGLKKNDSISSLFPKLKNIICGSAFVREYVFDFFDSSNINMFVGYGATECSPVIVCNSPYNNRKHSVGKVNTTPYCDVKIIDNEIAVSGQIVLQSCMSNTPYGKMFLTGDVGRIDRDGFLYILGRKDNKIILDNGYVVIPAVLEQIILNQSDCISEIKIICDSICGDGLTALVVPSLKNIAYELVDKEIKRISIRHFSHIRIKKIVVLHEGFKYSSLYKVKHIG